MDGMDARVGSQQEQDSTTDPIPNGSPFACSASLSPVGIRHEIGMCFAFAPCSRHNLLQHRPVQA